MNSDEGSNYGEQELIPVVSLGFADQSHSFRTALAGLLSFIRFQQILGRASP